MILSFSGAHGAAHQDCPVQLQVLRQGLLQQFEYVQTYTREALRQICGGKGGDHPEKLRRFTD